MQKARAFVMILLIGLAAFSGFYGQALHAQEEQEEEPDYGDEKIPVESDWDGYMPNLYSKGDKTFSISAGVIFPVLFFNNGKLIDHHFSPPVGGSGSLAYNYFFGPHFNFGAEIGMMFNYTLAQNTVFIIPIGLRVGYQFVFRRFEFPLLMTIGFVPQRYLNDGYFGFFMKGGASAFYRFNPDWSFGLNVDWNWFPQWPMENGKPVPEKNMDGNIIGLTLSARYHF
jgi:hypothetical protein